VLRDLIRNESVRNAIIFCNRKVEVAILHKSLVKHGFSAGALHGDMDQKSRMETLDKFRSGELKLLAASDVAARGLDIPDVSHVFNFDLPWQSDDYVHRIGRTGRAGKEGNSTSLVTIDELKSLKDIEKMLGEPVEWIGEAPSDQDFAEAGKKRRGRGGRGARPGGGRGERGGRSGAPAQARGDDKGRRGGQRGGERRERGGERGEQRPEARAEQPREQREPREHREPKEHREPREQQPRQPREQRPEQREQPRAARPQQQPNGSGQNQSRPPRNTQADAKPAQQPRGERPSQQRQPERPRQPEGGRSGFADNVPAFLRNPVKRPAKVAGE
jgi:superfamily II DNA/RNA helicase